MADAEINDLDFYQTDYTNASSWEVFNFNLEEVLSSLRNYNELRKKNNGAWTTKTETIRLQDLAIEVTLYSLDVAETEETDRNGLQDSNFTFTEDLYKEIPPLWKWYKLNVFVLVTTTNDDVITEHIMKTVQSSVQMAVAETNCPIPVFLRVLNRKANMFLGVRDDAHIRTHYDMVFLRALPPNYKCFTGLWDIFKGKVGLSSDPIEVAVRLGFSTNELKDFTELGKRPDVEELKYPFGIETDPIKFMVLHCVWPELPTSVVMHNYTNFEPNKAKDWVLQCVFDDTPIEILSDFVEEFTDHIMNEDVLMETGMEVSLFSVHKPLNFISDKVKSKLRTENDRSTAEENTIPDDVVKKFLYYLFPDADTVDSNQDYKLEEKTSTFSKMKTGPKDSLLHRLALVLALAYNNFGNEYGLKYFWKEFFLEMRYRVDHCIEIPGITKGFPDYHTCLLHQKLQMVNVCINRRKQRTDSASSKGDKSTEESLLNVDSEEEEDFYDCEEDENVLIKPSGRLSPLGDLTLVGRPEEPIYIPETQDAVVKTEDELENDADVMLKLGPGSDLSSQMMSAALQSDMESFKAANPRAKIEDFIRWYSPRDWIETDGKGEISERMKIPGNTWQTVWAAARPIPAKRQKCLFDDAKEVEKVMFYLEHMKVGDLIYMIIPCLLEGAHETLAAELECFREFCPDAVTRRIPALFDSICKYSREYWSVGQTNAKSVSMNKWKYAIHEIRQLENVATSLKSICEKLNVTATTGGPNVDLVRGLLSGKPTWVPDGPNNPKWKEILQLFSQTHESEVDISSAETEREFLFRMNKTVGGGDVILPQSMRVLLKPNHNEYRICGAFSENVNIVYEAPGNGKDHQAVCVLYCQSSGQSVVELSETDNGHAYEMCC